MDDVIELNLELEGRLPVNFTIYAPPSPMGWIVTVGTPEVPKAVASELSGSAERSEVVLSGETLGVVVSGTLGSLEAISASFALGLPVLFVGKALVKAANARRKTREKLRMMADCVGLDAKVCGSRYARWETVYKWCLDGWELVLTPVFQPFICRPHKSKEQHNI